MVKNEIIYLKENIYIYIYIYISIYLSDSQFQMFLGV